MSVALPGAALLLGLSLVVLPTKRFFEPPKRVARIGPLRILPQIDIVAEEDEERRLTAAPKGTPSADFQVIEFEYAKAPEPKPRQKPQPAPQPVPDETPETSDLDQLQTAIRTTGHPVLAEAEYELIYLHRPVYPREAIQAGIEGEVLIMMLIDTHGRVAQAHLLNPHRYPLLEEAALDAVKKSLFKPYLVNGKPSPFWIRVPIEFRLVK